MARFDSGKSLLVLPDGTQIPAGSKGVEIPAKFAENAGVLQWIAYGLLVEVEEPKPAKVSKASKADD